jgi:polygalacturonase
LLFVHCQNITITSNSLGVIDGGGPKWWALPGIGFLQTVEHRPILLQVNSTQQVLVENLLLRDAPIYTLSLRNVNQATVRHVSILNRRTKRDGHSLLDLSA